jgi:hypothetical protein
MTGAVAVVAGGTGPVGWALVQQSAALRRFTQAE